MTSEETLPATVEDVQTPCFLVDIDKVKKNAKKMLATCHSLGIKLRPHLKTAKTIEAGDLMTDGTKRGVCVSTLREAEFYADNGYDDIIYALLFTASKLPRIRDLTSRLEAFHIFVDNPEGCKLLEDNPPPQGKKWSVYLVVDTGSGREGSLWNDPVTVELGNRLVNNNQVVFRGLYTHEGVSYEVQGKENVSAVANSAVERVLDLARRFEEVGVKCSDITIGATPTASLPGDKVKDITEMHPGNYVFYDAQQCNIGSCSEDEIACRVATRVIGQYPQRNQLLVDSGWSAASKDGKLPNGSYGLFQGYPHLRLVSMSQEYGFVEYDSASHTVEDFPLGTMLLFYPYHSCATAMQHQKYYIHEGNEIMTTWKPCSQW